MSVMFQLQLGHLQAVMLYNILTNTLCSCVNKLCSFIRMYRLWQSVLRYKSLKMTRSGMKNVYHVI